MNRVAASILALSIATQAAWAVTIEVKNPSSDDWAEAPVVVAWQKDFPKPEGKLMTLKGASEIPVQVDDLNGDGTPDEIVFLVKLKAGETAKYELLAAEPKGKVKPRAHTGMYLKTPERRGMEGPGWESDMIAFRTYWDPRNPVDVFGKTEAILSLEQFAETKHNYHMHSKWGQDILKVGKALGVGGYGAFIDNKVEKVSYTKRDYRIAADGPIRAALEMKFTDWETSSRRFNMTVRMDTFAGQDWAEAHLKIEPLDGKEVPELVTGVVKHPDTELVTAKGVVGRWGKQALGDKEVPKSANLGLGVIADPEILNGMQDDDVNSFVRLVPKDGCVTYRYQANWEKTPGAAKSAKEYLEMLKRIARLRPEVKVDK